MKNYIRTSCMIIASLLLLLPKLHAQSYTVDWFKVAGGVQHYIQPTEGALQIHENVWLIPLDNGMPFLVKLFDWASAGIPLRILFLDAEPEWIQYPKPAEAKPSQVTP